MLNKKHFLIFCFFLSLFSLKSQSRFPGIYLIEFSDKTGSIYSTQQPEAYLSEAAIARRIKFSIPITEQDFPVNSWYLDSLTNLGIKIIYCTRWKNAALIEISDSLDLVKVTGKSFFKSFSYLSPAQLPSKGENKKLLLEKEVEFTGSTSLGYAYNQFNLIGIPSLHSIGFRGKGVKIAVFDGGFSNVDKLKIYDSLRLQNRIKASINIVEPNNSVFVGDNHGTSVLSCMAAVSPNEYCGTAPEADYYLFRTENSKSEYPVEEAYWLIAAERADSMGVDIINSSLGYYDFDDYTLNLTHEDLDGETALVTQAAQIATEKGILVVNSAGNSGSQNWRKISFPADAKDVITVGAVSPDGQYADFSSQGYSADGRIKPEVVAVGKDVLVYNDKGNLVQANGTSFSSPTIAGGIACLVQSNPLATPDEIRKALFSSANYFKADSLVGYGIPNFYLANILLKKSSVFNLELDKTFNISPNPFSNTIVLYFYSEKEQTARAEIFDLNGNRVANLNQLFIKKGYNEFEFNDLSNLSSSQYVFQLILDTESYSQQLLKL